MIVVLRMGRVNRPAAAMLYGSGEHFDGEDIHRSTRLRALVLHWPVGGYRWKLNGGDRFARHQRFARDSRQYNPSRFCRGGVARSPEMRRRLT